jgi:hypothetical protein
MSSSTIQLLDPNPAPAQIRQLYPLLELYSLGEPPAHTLFVLGRPPLAVIAAEAADQLLLIDPPADARQRFGLPSQVAALFTGPPVETGLPLVQTSPGGLAHLRIGEHLLDIYSGRWTNFVHLPALGILCGGGFGSDVIVPHLGAASNGDEELGLLRQLARLVKARRLQLYIPRLGTLCDDSTELLRRLAADVAYLHSLQRVVPQLVKRGDALETVGQVAESLLPADRRSPLSQHIHEANLSVLYHQADQAASSVA